MSLMREQIRTIGERAKRAARQKARTSFCSHVVQIDFNAWHFVDTNLWASIVTRILSELARQLGGDPKRDPDKYHQALNELVANTARAKTAVVQAQAADAEAQTKVTELEVGLGELNGSIAAKEAEAPSVRDVAKLSSNTQTSRAALTAPARHSASTDPGPRTSSVRPRFGPSRCPAASAVL